MDNDKRFDDGRRDLGPTRLRFNGKYFYQLKSGYWYSTSQPKIYLHRYVWETIKGKIPEKFHVHHLDGNKSNNHIDNLSLISASDHERIHAKKYIKENPDKVKLHLDKIRPLSKKWHSSLEAKKFKRDMIKKAFFNGIKIKKNCEFCNIEIETTVGFREKRFCGSKCRYQIYKNTKNKKIRKKQCLLHEGKKK